MECSSKMVSLIKKISIGIKNKLISVSGLIIIVVLWHIVSLFIPSFLLPPPIATLRETFEVLFSTEFVYHASLTFRRAILGFSIAFIISNVLALTSSFSHNSERFLRPIILSIFSLPAFVGTFIGIVLFGSRGPVAIIVTSILLIPELFLILYPAYNNLSTELAELARVYRLSKITYIQEIVLPQILPYLFSATRVGFMVGWKITLLTEVFSISSGIGYKIQNYFYLFSIKGVFAWFFSFALIMMVIEYTVIRSLEKKFTAHSTINK